MQSTWQSTSICLDVKSLTETVSLDIKMRSPFLWHLVSQAALTLLGLSLSFNTVDSGIFIDCVSSWLVVCGFYLFVWGFMSFSRLYRSYHDE